MSTTETPGRIVVGVDGTDVALTAVRYAATEALRTRAALEIAHAGPGSLHLGAGPLAYYPLTAAEYRGIGTKILTHARKVAREVTGEDWEIRTALLDGPSPWGTLEEHARGARELVVGGRRRPLVDRMLVGSVAAGVAGHARVPVVLVPEGWSHDDPKSVVVVGLGDLESGADLLRAALAIAADRGATLRVVHAWQLPRLYDDLAVTHLDTVQWHQEKMAQVQSVLDRVSGEFPDVRVDVSLVHYQPAKALEAASKTADLLVLGRHRHGLRHLGATARAVLWATSCPVEVLPTPEARAHASRSEVREGALTG